MKIQHLAKNFGWLVLIGWSLLPRSTAAQSGNETNLNQAAAQKISETNRWLLLPMPELLTTATSGDREAQYYYWTRAFRAVNSEGDADTRHYESNFYGMSAAQQQKFVEREHAEQGKWKNASEEELLKAAQGGDLVAEAVLNRIRGDKRYERLLALVPWLEKSASQGFPQAEADLALHYLGEAGWTGIKMDLPKGLDYIRRAADHGLAFAQYELGIFHLEGGYMPQDLFKAVDYFRLSADQNYARAEYELAQLYANGFGQSRDNDDFPVALLKKSAWQNYWPAWRALAERYRTGLSVPRDYVRAMDCYRYCDTLRRVHGSFGGRLPGLDKFAQGDEPNLSPEFKPFAKVLGYYTRAIDQGDPAATEQIGDWYASGHYLPRNLVQAGRWYDFGAKQGSSTAAAKRDAIETKLTPDELERVLRPAHAIVPQEL